MRNWRIWLKGLAAAIVGGTASGLAAAIVAPEQFNATHAGLAAAAKLSLVSAVFNAAAYLKQSPLPIDNGGKA